MIRACRAPFETVMKPYGTALVELARQREDVICLGADLTRQTETDLFRDAFPDRFVNGAMAEQNLMGVAAGLARKNHIVFVNTFGVFATRRPFEQVAMQIAYANLNVKIVGLMPGLSTPGGPSHQANDDIALMRSLPNMRVIDVADATEVSQVVPAIADLPGPVYLRLKRGVIPVLFGPDHVLDLDHPSVIDGDGTEVDVAIFATGMLVASALTAADALRSVGLSVDVVNVTQIKPIGTDDIRAIAARARAVVTAENHTILGGLGSAVAEIMAEHALGVPLRRVGIADQFAEAATARFLFQRYGLSSQHIVRAAVNALRRPGPEPVVQEVDVPQGAYSPV